MGLRRFCIFMKFAILIVDAATSFLLPLGTVFLVAKIFLLTALTTPIMPIAETVFMQFPHAAPDVNGACVVLFKFVGGIASAVATKFFQIAFDPNAITYFNKVRPFLA